MGGDEFVVVLNNVVDLESAAKVAKMIASSLAQPFEVNGAAVRVTASIGISVFPMDGQDVDALLKNADTAMYYAKERGRDEFQFFTRTLSARAAKRFSIESQLSKALENDELILHYQPKTHLATGAVTGVEALLRWNHPEFGLVGPNEFIPVAEASGLILPIGEWTLKAAFKTLRELHESGFPHLTMAVNISGVQFRQKDVARKVIAIIRESGLDPRCVELELTESVLIERTDETVERLNALKRAGIRISIDDFGTGYSSLIYLRRFPLTSLKIDRAFVRDIATSPDDAAIVNATIALAHSLRLSVIAEGVETEEQLRFLEAQSCDEVQGYLIAKPLPKEGIRAWLDEPRQRQAVEKRELDLTT